MSSNGILFLTAGLVGGFMLMQSRKEPELSVGQAIDYKRGRKAKCIARPSIPVVKRSLQAVEGSVNTDERSRYQRRKDAKSSRALLRSGPTATEIENVCKSKNQPSTSDWQSAIGNVQLGNGL